MSIVTIHKAKTNLSKLSKRRPPAKKSLSRAATNPWHTWSRLANPKANASPARSRANSMSGRNSSNLCHITNCLVGNSRSCALCSIRTLCFGGSPTIPL